MSDGQKCRVCLAWLAWQNPHMLFLDEPTNHLDIRYRLELMEMLSGFDGMVLIIAPGQAQQAGKIQNPASL